MNDAKQTGWEGKRKELAAERERDEASRRKAVLERLKRGPKTPVVLSGMLGWPGGIVGVGAVLRQLAERDEAHEGPTPGVWSAGPGPGRRQAVARASTSGEDIEAHSSADLDVVTGGGVETAELDSQPYNQRVKAARLARGLSQSQLGELVGLSGSNRQAAISAVERGDRRCNSGSLRESLDAVLFSITTAPDDVAEAREGATSWDMLLDRAPATLAELDAEVGALARALAHTAHEDETDERGQRVAAMEECQPPIAPGEVGVVPDAREHCPACGGGVIDDPSTEWMCRACQLSTPPHGSTPVLDAASVPTDSRPSAERRASSNGSIGLVQQEIAALSELVSQITSTCDGRSGATERLRFGLAQLADQTGRTAALTSESLDSVRSRLDRLEAPRDTLDLERQAWSRLLDRMGIPAAPEGEDVGWRRGQLEARWELLVTEPLGGAP